MRDRLLLNGMCSGSRDLYKFWEITDNISETVQDRHNNNNNNTSICKAHNVSKHTESEAQAVARRGGWRE